MKAPAFQMYAADIYMDTNEWSAEAFGIYNRLLNHQWVNGSIPKDMKTLAQISFIGIKTMAKRWPEMVSKFEFDNTNRGRNKRLEETRQKQLQYSEMQRQKGLKRSEKMWEGHIAVAIPTAINRLQPEALPKDSSSSSTSSSKRTKTPYTPEFETFWSAYPRKVAKGEAWKAWGKQNGNRPKIEIILATIEKWKQADQWQKDGGQFIPHPATWINSERWHDDPKIQITPKEEAWKAKIPFIGKAETNALL
jgi:uncharacterized protein YdaU (DUF1376 family)